MGQPSDSEDHTPSPGTETPPDNGGTPPTTKEDMGRILLGAKDAPTDSGKSDPELSEDARKAIERAEKRAKDNQAQYTKAQQALAEREKRIRDLEEKLGSGNDNDADVDDKTPVDDKEPELSDEARELLEETPGMKELLELNKGKPEGEKLSKDDIIQVLEERERKKQEDLEKAERVKREHDEAVKRDKEWREHIDKELDGASQVIEDPAFLDWCNANPNQLNTIRDQFEESDPQCPVEIIRTYLDSTQRVGGLRRIQQRTVSAASGRPRSLPTPSGQPKGSSNWAEAVKKAKERRS